MTLASAMTKRTDAAWAAGSGNGGWLDGASMPNGTGHTFLMRNPTTGAVDVGVSASLSPTLPTGYTQKRRIHSAVLRESGALALLTQSGNTFTRSVRVQDVTAVNPGVTAVTRTLSVPVGVPVTAFGDVQITVASSSGAGFFALLTSLSQADSDPERCWRHSRHDDPIILHTPAKQVAVQRRDEHKRPDQVPSQHVCCGG